MKSSNQVSDLSSSERSQLQHMTSKISPTLFALVLWGMLACFLLRSSIRSFQASFLGLSCVLFCTAVGLYWVIKRRIRSAHHDSKEDSKEDSKDNPKDNPKGWGLTLFVRREHLIQTIAQSIVYIGWMFSWEIAWDHLPMIFAQILFAYLVDMIIIWRTYPHYRLGLGPIPVVLSINLFLFFTDASFHYQWPMITLAFLSKELFRWRRDGHLVHIFNPSAIALSITALALIFSNSMHLSWGEAIARTHGNGAYAYELIFLSGLLVMSFFTVGFTIVSATLSTLLLGALYTEQTGVYRYLDTGIPIAVFLGINLLITDPATSPRRRDAKVLYGILYGLSVFLLYGILRDIERLPMGEDPGLNAAFCDKLLAVPLLNLLSGQLDGLMKSVEGVFRSFIQYVQRLNQLNTILDRWTRDRTGRLIFVSFWCLIFFSWVHPQLKDHPGRDIRFWINACDHTPPNQRGKYACENRDRLYRRACNAGENTACHNLALSLEERATSETLSASVQANTRHWAESLYDKACDSGLAESCNHLGFLWFKRGEETQDRALIERALKLLKIGCTQHIAESCTRQATLLRSRWFDQSQWTAQNWLEIWELLNFSCSKEEPFACFELAQWALRPPQLRRDMCYQGNGLGCIAWQRLKEQKEGVSGEFKIARHHLKIACHGEVYIACGNLGWMLWRGDGGARQPRVALKWMELACKNGVQKTCERVQWMKENIETQLKVSPSTPNTPQEKF